MDKKNKIIKLSLGYPIAAFVILLLFSTVAIISAVGTYNISVNGSQDLLETRGVDIAVNLGFTLERLGFKRELFPDVVESSKWRDLAFLALYDKNGWVLLHSNPYLIGTNQKDRFISASISEGRPCTHFLRLATGEDVFVVDFPLRLHPEKVMEGQDPLKEEEVIENAFIYVLRVSLHPFPAQKIVRKANFQLILIGISLLILWILTFFFLVAWKRNEALKSRLREQERMAALGEMAAVLAHEIRNPLSSIKGFAQFHINSDGDPGLLEDLKIIVKESTRLERLTSDLLLYARPFELHEEELDVRSFASELKRSMNVIPEDIRLDFEVEDCKLKIDPEKFKQIAINLIMNAFDAVRTKEGGKIKCSFFCEKGGLSFVVDDNGPGIPEEIKDRVFEPFVTTKTKGTGLGLAIVKRLVEGMGGVISIEKSNLGGACMKLTMPFHRMRKE